MGPEEKRPVAPSHHLDQQQVRGLCQEPDGAWVAWWWPRAGVQCWQLRVILGDCHLATCIALLSSSRKPMKIQFKDTNLFNYDQIILKKLTKWVIF